MFGEFMIEMDEQYLAYRGWYGVVTLPKNNAYLFCHCKCHLSFARSFFVYLSLRSFVRAVVCAFVRSVRWFVCAYVRVSCFMRSCVRSFVCS